MNFLRSRAEQLAEHLRDSIVRGELRNPVPSIRAWSKELNVSRSTLESTLPLLQKDGLIEVLPRGIRVKPLAAGRKPKAARVIRRVRMLFYALQFGSYYWPDWVERFSERLHRHQIECGIEKCSSEKLESVLREKCRDGELLLLLTLPSRLQLQFARCGKPALIIGEPDPEVSLPFVRVDQDGAIHHATMELLRRGFPCVNFVVEKVQTPGIRRAIAAFRSACALWPHQPIRGAVIEVPVDESSLMQSVRRLAKHVRDRQGFVVLPPIAVGTIMTALLQQGVAVPRQVELAAVFPTPESVLVFPQPTYYPFPTNRLVKVLTETVMHFFVTGSLPAKGRVIPVEVIRPSQTRGVSSST